MENQVPFFVLKQLFQEAFGAAYPDVSFRDLAFGYVRNAGVQVGRRELCYPTFEKLKNEQSIDHLVDLLWKLGHPFYLRETARNPPSKANVQSLSSVSNLKACGVRFVASKSINLQDITFNKGILEIPPIQIWGISESIYRSIILFEQSHRPIRGFSYIVDYMLFLRNLIKSSEDMRILVECGVIENGPDSAVAQLFNDITSHIVVPVNVSYDDVCRKLDAFANRRWNKWKAILMRDYFAHPWAVISVVFALVLFILTLVQTIGTYTVK